MEGVRDLLGLTRSLYAAESADGDWFRLVPIGKAGEMIAQALRLSRAAYGTREHAAAAELVLRGAAELLSTEWSNEVALVILAARDRAVRAQPRREPSRGVAS